MNKQKYLDNLLALCTEEQTNLFNRMYPDGPPNDKVDFAIMQVENTIRQLNKKTAAQATTLSESKEQLSELTAVNSELTNQLSVLQTQYNMLALENERLSTPINVENNKTQERLLLLDALEAGGVDNWEWYDESITNFWNQ